jgi:hypothetical protein
LIPNAGALPGSAIITGGSANFFGKDSSMNDLPLSTTPNTSAWQVTFTPAGNLITLVHPTALTGTLTNFRRYVATTASTYVTSAMGDKTLISANNYVQYTPSTYTIQIANNTTTNILMNAANPVYFIMDYLSYTIFFS